MGQIQETNPQRNAALSTDYVNIFVQFVADKGILARDILANTGIDPLAISHSPYVNSRQLNQLLSNASDQLNDLNWGLEFGKRLHVGAHGLLGHVSTSAANSLQSLQTYQKFLQIRNQLVSIDYELTQNSVIIIFEVNTETSFQTRPIIDGCVSGLITVMKTKLALKLSDINIQLSYTKPKDITPLNATLGNNITFNNARNSIEIPLAVLMQHNASANSGVFQLVQQQSEAALSHIKQQHDLPNTINRYLSENPEMLMSQESMAKKLNMTSRTLRRRLQHAGFNYQEIQNSVKKNVAIRYLQNTTWSVQEISERLGYSEEVNFSRAFKRWVGMTPSLFRKQSVSGI